ncbi:MAG: hypothetical protein ACI351_06400 [Candidatus Avelusimicrobium sp.]|uniref:hypothetical protein n=1 Tax=Candidatus Avelusimicrobium sp. TaxID=3048833 RepID=UPI003F0E8800
MRALLSLLLSVCLLVGSVTPSLAQVWRGGRQVVKGARRLPQSLEKAASSTVAPKGFSLTLSSRISRLALQQTPTSISIRTQMKSGQRNGLARQILSVRSLAEQAPLLRNEFVTLALEKHVSSNELSQAVAFYRADLQKSSASLAQFSGQNFDEAFASAYESSSPLAQDFLSARDALTDAAALGLFGSKADAPVLVSFYQQAKGTAFEDLAAAVTARGLLCQGAYEELAVWAQANAADNFFWQELAAYTQEHGIAVEWGVEFTGKTVDVSPVQKQFLSSGWAFNALNADFSRAATEKWLSLGKEFPAHAPAVKTAETLSAASTEVTAPNLSQALSGVQLTPSNLGVAPVEMASSVSAAEVPPVPAQVKTPAVAPATASSNSGMLYSGIPVFAMADAVKKTYQGLRRLFSGKKATQPAVPEEPGLHENTVQPVYEARRVAADEAVDDWINPMPFVPVEVAENGFKLTVENEDGVESILKNVEITIDASIKTKGYNRITFRKDHIFELRNLTLEPGQMDHFFFEMPNTNGELVRLGMGAQNLHLPRPLRIKLEKVPNQRYKVRSLGVYKDESSPLLMTADVDASLVPAESGYLLADEGGAIWFVSEETGRRTLLDGYYIRLPKEDSRYWTRVMQQDGQPFTLGVHSTSRKTTLLTMSVPSLQIGLGKTTAPELNARTNLSESTSSMIMLGINNVLPILMGFVHPLLKRYGEAAVARWGMGFFLAGGLTALGSGLYGALGDGSMTSLQTVGFITSSILIAMGTNITRFVQNILISANRGVPTLGDSFKKKPVVKGAATEVPDFAHFTKRIKEVARFKKGVVRDGALFQTASMFKNIGTMAFLAFPWLANRVSELAFGVNLGLDFSASYVPYTLWAGWTAWKLSRTAYKDAFPMNLNVVENRFRELLASSFNGMEKLSAEALMAESGEMTALAKKLSGMIDSLTAVEVRHKKGDGKKLIQQHEAEAVQAFQEDLISKGVPAAQAEQAGLELQKAFDTLGHRNVRLWDVFRLKALSPSLLAMTLATVHELSVSNGFAFAMHDVLGDGTYANALTALTLYGSMSVGRILGNLISRYLSGGSMYALSSLFSIGGTALMAFAGDSISQLMTGAVIASFGVGNFFSQMYEYMTGLYPKYKREISLLINYTMPLAAVMSFPMRWLVNYTGVSGLDLMLSGAAVTGSVMLTPGMLANSTVVQVAKYEGGRMWTKMKNLFKGGGKHNTPSDNLDDAVAAQ